MPQENPFYYNLPTHPEDFVGRWPLVNIVVADLCQPRPDSWALIGGRRFGKSSVLKAIEARLASRLNHCEERDWLIFPLLVDLKRCKPDSEQHIYACILHYLYRALRRSRACKAHLLSTDLHATATEDCDCLSFFQFEDTLEDLVRQMDSHQGPFRLALLLDEVESMTHFDWSETLFNQLRALIYDGPLAAVVKLVLTGSANVIRARQSGSPLLNALKIEHLSSLSEIGLQSLIARGGKVSDEAAVVIQTESGGHPFIAQYLLHHAWDDGLAHTNLQAIEQIACQMRQHRSSDLKGWWEAIGDSGQWAYAVLAMAQDWLDERTLLKKVHHTEQSLDQGLSALCYHGLVKRDESRRRYRIVGKLFFDWFALNGAECLAESETKPEDAQVIIEHLEQHIGAQTNIAGDASGPVASGQFESAVAVGGGEAVDLRGSRGALHKPTGPVDQQFGNRTVVHTTGDVVFGSQPDGALDLAPSPEATRLHRILVDRMDLEEFRTLCFDLGVSYDSLRGEGLAGKARQLVLFLQKREALPLLVEWLRRERPDIRSV